jgi:hypothetical protein
MKEKNYKMVVKTIKERLKIGDIAAICRRGGFTPMTFRKACKAESWESLTRGELNAIEEAVAFFEERNELMKRASELL